MKGERNRQSMRKQITEKLKEALASVLPVTAIVLLLQFFFPIPKYMLISFIIGAVLLIIGIALFTLGADTAMMPMGERMGSHIVKSGSYKKLIPIVFLIGAIITIAEPDLQVLANQFNTVNRWTVILTVAAGVGVSFAKSLSFATGIPLIGVHHIEGHICANYIENKELKPPFMALVVSGGHTHLVKVADYGEYEILGRTRDDAAGEAFDKVARAIGLGYPGGPKVDKVSKEGNPDAIVFPKAKVNDSVYDFSFSGLKSAVLNYLNQAQMKDETINVADVAASFQKAVVDVLVEHTIQAAGEYGFKEIALAGGVASNSSLRSAMEEACKKRGLTLYRPSPIFCTDNAAMIGVAGYYEYIKGNRSDFHLNAVPSLKLGER